MTDQWKFDHLRKDHAGCWIDSEKYKGEEVEKGYWSCCKSESWGGPGCIAIKSTPVVLAVEHSSNERGKRHTGTYFERETYHGEVVEEGGWSCCGDKNENSTTCS